MSGHSFSRRGLFTAAAATGTASLLAACSGGSNESGTESGAGKTSATPTGSDNAESLSSSGPSATGGSSAVGPSSGAGISGTVLPAYKAYHVIQPDIASSRPDVMDAYFSYPKNSKEVVTNPPGAGLGEITTLTHCASGLPTPMSKNKFWQELNKRIGATMNISWISDDYAKKFATIIAGNDLPDLTFFTPGTPNTTQVLHSLFEDLTPYLSGDNIKEYPFLGDIPTFSWLYTLSEGAIYSVPQSRPSAWILAMRRTDIYDSHGANATPSNFAEFTEMLKSVTDEKNNLWAWGLPSNLLKATCQMREAPNNWAVQDGKFSSMWEDDRTKAALSDAAAICKAGYLYPDAFSIENHEARTLFNAGRVAIHMDGLAAWPLLAGQGNNNIGYFIPPKHDGGGLAKNVSYTGAYAMTVIKKGLGDQKIKRLLSVLNWLAAPVGTQGFIFRTFGIEGVDFTWKDGTPTPTDAGKSEVVPFQLQYIVNSPYVIGPGAKDQVTAERQWNVDAVNPGSIDDPSVGLYSDTNQTKGASLTKMVTDGWADIMQGRKPLSHWDDIIKQWKSGGGDQTAKEYAEAYAKANG